MSSSHAYQEEEQNEFRLKELASKISALRSVTNDIHEHASDHNFIDSATDTIGSIMTSVKSSSGRLARSINAGHPIFKMAGLALLVFFLFYILYQAV